ncbi:MAG: hypothetical protein WCG04_02075 [Alphaproteobacteria bacterium]
MLKHRADGRFLDCFARARNDGSGIITSSPPSLRGVYDEAIQAFS